MNTGLSKEVDDMSWYSTAGLASPTQVLDTTPEWSMNLDVTDSSIPLLEEVSPEELEEEETKASPLVKIKLPPEYAESGFYLLLRAAFLQCFPDNVFILESDSLRVLDEANIPYQMV